MSGMPNYPTGLDMNYASRKDSFEQYDFGQSQQFASVDPERPNSIPLNLDMQQARIGQLTGGGSSEQKDRSDHMINNNIMGFGIE